MKALDLKSKFNITPLAAYGLVFLGVLIGVWFFEAMVLKSSQLEMDMADVRGRVAGVESIQQQDFWAARLDYARSEHDRLDQTLWSGKTSGVIAAQLQQKLKNISDDNGLTRTAIQVDPEPTEIGGLQVISFEFAGQMPSALQTADILATFASSPRQIIMGEAEIVIDTRARTNSRISLAGIAPIKIEPGPQSARGAETMQ